MAQAIRIEDDGAVRGLVLCRPDEFNTITPALRDELDAALEGAERDPGVKVVLVTAEGPAFCAGFGLDWSTHGQATAETADGRVWDTVADVQVISRFGDTFAKLHTISKPTIAAVRGLAYGGGLELAVCCDLLVVEDDGRLALPEIKLGVFPGSGGTVRVSRRIGEGRAKEMMFFGEPIAPGESAYGPNFQTLGEEREFPTFLRRQMD